MLSPYRLLCNNIIRQQTSNITEMPYLPAVWVAYLHRIMDVSGSCLGRGTGCLGKRLVVVSLRRVENFGMVPTIGPLCPSKHLSVH